MKTRHYQMAKRVCVFLPLYLFTFLSITAQTFTQRIQQDTKTGGRLTVNHSQAIDDLVNGRSSESHPILPSNGRVATSEGKANGSHTPQRQGEATATVTPTPKKDEPKPVVTPMPRKDELKPVVIAPLDTATAPLPTEPRKKVMVGTQKVTGYRVQAFAGGNQRKDRVKAEQTAANIKAHFPDEPVYTHFYSPRWICRVGNYRTYEEAHEMLTAIKKLGYSTAIIVKGKITVQKTE